uniref:Chromosome 3 open reading frame 38 n=1 Tax=Amphilophus citrinellus TaxID=61819 RepID=A0A3Q0QS48_AMPCI
MSGLSETERAGFTKILSLMTTSDLLSLSDTVTNKVIVVENITEAQQTILSFTKNAEELLRRKKVHRDLIFKYLATEGVAMPPNSEKHTLVKRTLELWSSVKVRQDVRETPHGLKALTSPHGLVLVAVAGTIHRDAACLGIFEQIFGLIRSPLENNSWKIKFVNLKVRGQDALGGTDVAAPALTYNSSELQLLCSR